MSTTIKDIAKMANVSTATVSRVLNSPDLVSVEKKELINKIIYELNYQPNALARGLIKKETKTVGVLIPDIDNLFYPAVVRGIEDVLGSKDYNVFICNTDKDVEKEKKYINTLLLYTLVILLEDYWFSPDNGLSVAWEFFHSCIE